MDRPALQHATYRGDVTHMVGQPVGPTMENDFLTAVEATFDPETNTTRVGFAYGLPAPVDGMRWVWGVASEVWVQRPVEEAA